ncbi:MAG: hypothetical protein LBP81_05335 [Treponema sp.]|nr:hypothetical protein [Treponema sp.]
MVFFTLGFLAVLLAGCFNSITVIPQKQDDSNIEPFTVDIEIGEERDIESKEKGRSAAGPDAARIKGGISNFVQLVVADGKGNIVAFDEVRRGRDEDDEAVLKIGVLPFGETYYFLLLLGHWERDYKKETPGEDYVYTGNPPTLLAAGFKEEQVTGSGKVTITMWPVVVDTVFTSASGGKTAEPALDSTGTPGEVILHPAGWDVKWTIKEGLTGNWRIGLVTAQKLINSEAGDALLLRKAETLVRDTAVTWQDSTLNRNVITRSIRNTTGFGNIGNAGSVNFKLEYVPFNLTGGKTNPWTQFNEKSAFNLEGSNEPVWIIRNGVNDEAQNDDTDFTSFNRLFSETVRTPNANGNGAVRYKVAVKTPAAGSALTVSGGVFEGPWTSTTPKISFTTGGYTGTAEVYYAVVEAGKGPPDYSAYGLLAEAGPGKQTQGITVPGTKGNYDVYVIVYKDGEVSAPLIIKTIPATFTLRIIRMPKSIDTITQIAVVPVMNDGYHEGVYRTGHTGKKWTSLNGETPDETRRLKDFQAMYPQAQYYPMQKSYGGTSSVLANDYNWADVTINWPAKSVTGYYIFFIEGDGRIRGYANPGQLDPKKEENYLFFVRPDYVYKHFLLPMGTTIDNGSTEVNPKTTAYKEVIPIGYQSYYNLSSILKSTGVWGIPRFDQGNLTIK